MGGLPAIVLRPPLGFCGFLWAVGLMKPGCGLAGAGLGSQGPGWRDWGTTKIRHFWPSRLEQDGGQTLDGTVTFHPPVIGGEKPGFLDVFAK